MKLASLKNGRDGRLVLVSDDLAWYADASQSRRRFRLRWTIWDGVSLALANLATDLAHEMIPMQRFHERAVRAPLACLPVGRRIGLCHMCPVRQHAVLRCRRTSLDRPADGSAASGSSRAQVGGELARASETPSNRPAQPEAWRDVTGVGVPSKIIRY